MVEPEEKNLQPAPIQLLTVEDTRFFHCNTKTLNLLPNVVAAQHAKEAGCEEAVFIRDGFVTECAHSNIHILKAANGTEALEILAKQEVDLIVSDV